MNRAQLRAFVAVAMAEGFSSAARKLGLTQPALTHQVRALEAAYGVTLFHRTGRKVVLSETGQELLLIARRIFALEEEADAVLAAAGGLRKGTLRVAADSPYHVVPILARMAEKHPGITLTVTVGNAEQMQRSLLELRTDVAILAQVTDDPQLYARALSKHPVAVFVSKDHPWARKKRVSLSQLDGEPMVVRERGSETRRAFEEAIRKMKVQPRVVLEIESREAVREAVAAGIGFGVVSAVELGFDKRLALLPIKGEAIYTQEHVVCLEDRRQARAIRAFFEVAMEVSKPSTKP